MTAGLHRDLHMLAGVLRHGRRSLTMGRRRLGQLGSSLQLARPVEAFHGVVPQPIFLCKRAVQGGYVRRRDRLASRTELLPRRVDPSRARGAHDAGWRGHRTEMNEVDERQRDAQRARKSGCSTLSDETPALCYALACVRHQKGSIRGRQ